MALLLLLPLLLVLVSLWLEKNERFAVARTAIAEVPPSSTMETEVSQHTHVYSSSGELTGSGIALKAK